jgi:transposase InsO family protein
VQRPGPPDELLNVEEFGTLLEAQVVVETRRVEYNTYQPHSVLGGLTPAEFPEGMDHRTPAPITKSP